MNKSRKVFKYSIKPALAIPQEAAMPRGARIVHAAEQDRSICLWAEVDEDEKTRVRLFQVFGTGHDIPENAAHRGTVHMTPFVWHVYELL